MFVNIIDSYRHVVAICDKDLIGKRFEQGKLQLDVKESFYKGEEKSLEQVKDIILRMSNEDATFNIVGEKAIKISIEMGIINKKAIKTIQNIPFAMVLL